MAKVRTSSRICFGLVWYDDEAEAEAEAQRVRDAGRTYNGGWFDGKPCGREPGFDYTDDESEKRCFAVSR